MNHQSKAAKIAQRSRLAFLINLAIVLVVALGFGAWIGHRLNSDSAAKPQPKPEVVVAAVEPAVVPAAPLPVIGNAMGGAAMAESDDEPSDPEDEKPLVLGKADPELDKNVADAAKSYGEQQGTKKLPSPLKVTATAARNPAEIAARIDAILETKMAAAKVPASPTATDAEFLRRAYLDIVGVIPSVSKTKAFLDSSAPEKRANLVKELLADNGYGANFANYWHDLLVKRDIDNNKLIKTHDLFTKWLGHQFNTNRPWNEIVHAMLTGSGDQALVGETFFVLANAENGQPAPNKIVGTASALFLGNQLMCCECHVHPMTPAWKQSDFWGLAAFFGKTRAERANNGKKNTNDIAKITDTPAPAKGPKGKNAVVANTGTQADGSIAIPDPKNTGKYIGTAKASLLDDQPVSSGSVNRNVAADWFTSPTNPFFARAAGNRLWAVFFARGLIDPLDDIRPDSVATHPEILELLAEEFVASKFDQKHMIEILCRTQAYQRSSQTSSENKNDVTLYSHMAMKVLTPRSLFRSYAIATANQIGLPDEPSLVGKPAKIDTGNAGLAFFDAREYDENPGEYTYGVPQMLRLINTKLPTACDSVAKTAAKFGSRDKVIDHLYLTALSRHPSAQEMKAMSDYVGKQSDPQKGYSAVMWVLLNSAEFVNVH